ncbi:MAG: ABC transporter permease [Terriglobales bacterium]
MHLAEAILIALETLRTHKLRSFLTLLGVIISVCTLVAVVSLVQGVNGYVAEKIAGLGSNTFSVNQFSLDQMTDAQKFMQAKKHNKPLRMEEYRFLLSAAHLPRAIAASVGRGSANVKIGTHSLQDVHLNGETANGIGMAAYQVAQGRFLLPSDDQHRTNAVFIGNDLFDHLFGDGPALGKTLLIDGRPFRVVGVATALGNVFGQSQDNFAVIPIGTYQKIYGDRESLDIQVQARSAVLLPATMDEIEMLMRAERHLKYHDPDTFGLIGADALMNLWHALTGAIAAVMVGVSFVFLVVGGIVIMNIMLAAVTERTREIGTRKALGARQRDILWQFLIESAVLSTVGGVVGVAIAYLFTLAAGALTPIPFSLPITAVVAAVMISTLVGLFFGIYPASKAAKLQPIVALRAEA